MGRVAEEHCGMGGLEERESAMQEREGGRERT